MVEGLGAIDRAELTLGDGLSALTGETGAGKTLLVAALGLLIGDRADKTLVREGADAAVVEGRFSIPADHPAALALIDDELAVADGETVEVVITRSVPRDGRSARCRINGRIATATALQDLGSSLVEIAGQHQHQQLGDAAVQRSLLDSFAGEGALTLARTVRDLVTELRSVERELDALESTGRERERELDVLRFEVAEIEAARVERGETERLQQQVARLEHASTIAESASRADAALKGEGGAVDSVVDALRAIDSAAELDPSLSETAARLRSLSIDLTDVADSISSEEITVDPAALEQVRDRLGQLARLKRKYGEDENGVLAYLDKAQSRLRSLDDPAGSVQALRDRVAELRDEATEASGRLSSVRNKAARKLEGAMGPLLAELALKGARFEAALEPCDLYEGGAERIDFRIAANPGETARSVTKVASGGELSRISLALHVLTGTAAAGTLVFDEVDAGVGGEAALAVGRALLQLASERGAQVLVVTHLPQVAAFADRQYRVAKRAAGGRSQVDVSMVEGAGRVEELSRMLAGMPESEKARQHAAELLEIAGRTR